MLFADAAEQAGVRRFLQVSSMGAGQPPGRDGDEVWAAYIQAKTAAEDDLRERDLDWTILRPGGLTDASGTGLVTLTAPPVPRGQVPRADVAAVILALLREPAAAGRTLELVSGQTPIGAAVAALRGSLLLLAALMADDFSGPVSESENVTEYRVLGRTGLKVSPLCLGAMMFGWWGEALPDESARIIDRALEAGINFIDTADVYSQGQSEEFVGQALARSGKRDEVVLATKCHGVMGEGPNQRGNSRRWIFQAVENSLRRLGTDWIDLYQIHRPDPYTHIEETLGALTDLVRQGKVRYIGSSTFPAHQVVQAQWAAERRGLERFVCEQPPYSLLVRGIEADLLPVAQTYGMGVITWSPLAGGWLTGQYRKGREVPQSRRAGLLPERYDMKLEANQRKAEAAEQLAVLAEEAGVTLVELALAFTLRHPAVTSTIIGPRTMEHLESQLGAADVRLGDEVLDRIDQIVAPGVTLNPADAGWQPPELADATRRRR